MTNKSFIEQELVNLIEKTYNKYIVPDKGEVPKSLIIGMNHPISAMRAELLENINPIIQKAREGLRKKRFHIHYCNDCEGWVKNYGEHNADHSINHIEVVKWEDIEKVLEK